MVSSQMAFFYAHLSLLPPPAAQTLFFSHLLKSVEIQNMQQKRMPGVRDW